jgi:type I restriction enzyme S subunit
MNKTLLPKLRFPEFRDAPEWEEKEVGEVFKVTRGEVLSMTLVQDTRTKEAPYPVYSSQTKNNGLSGFYSKYLYEDAITWTTDGANAGDVNYRQGKFFCTNVCGVLINTDGYANRCVASLINNVSRKYVSYVGNPKLMNGVMSKIKIPFPSVAEQQKIADCLTALDDLIAAQSQKVEALQTYKKGLMQNLFPAEGESVPRLRFPEFQSAGEWETKKLINVSPAIFDGTHQTPTYVTEGVPFYSVENIVSGAKNKFISHDDYVIATSRNKPEKGDILLTRIGKIGFSQVVTWDFDFSIYVTLAVIKGSKYFVSHYLHYFMQSARYQTELFSKSLMNAVPPKINMDSLRETEILLPSIEEQQRIAELLSVLDEQISAQGEALAALKVHKKGLMQQLFPSEGNLTQ